MFLIFLFTTVHLFLASFLFLSFDKEMFGLTFGIEYVAITFSAFLLAGIIIREKIIALNFLKKFSIEEAQEKISNRKINKWNFPVACLPGGALFLYRLFRKNFNMPISLCTWVLASVFLIFALISGYNLITAIHLRLFKVYKEYTEFT